MEAIEVMKQVLETKHADIMLVTHAHGLHTMPAELALHKPLQFRIL